MNKITGVTELQRNFKRVFDDVTHKKAAHVLTRKSRPEAVLLPYDEYVRLTQLNASEITTRFDQILARMRAANAKFSDEEIDADLRQASKTIHKTRRQHARRR